MEQLILSALEARKYSYSPYSGFRVGAALETADGIIYTGCNIENAAFTPTNCAERTAFFKAVSDGKRNFKRIVIAGGYEEEPENYCAPCGVCRQVMREFCQEEFAVILARSVKDYKEYTLGQLFPKGFGPQNLV